jgi:hypothetical protein
MLRQAHKFAKTLLVLRNPRHRENPVLETLFGVLGPFGPYRKGMMLMWILILIQIRTMMSMIRTMTISEPACLGHEPPPRLARQDS